MSLIFNIRNTLQLAYIYDKLIIKAKTVKEIEFYNELIALGLLEYKGFNELWLTEKGLKYIHKENNQHE